LVAKGYNALAATNTTDGKTYATSLIEYSPGFNGEALALAQALNLPETDVVAMANPSPVANALGADIIVVVGKDLATRTTGTTATTRPAVTGTTTTVRRATTTTSHTATTKATTTTTR